MVGAEPRSSTAPPVPSMAITHSTSCQGCPPHVAASVSAPQPALGAAAALPSHSGRLYFGWVGGTGQGQRVSPRGGEAEDLNGEPASAARPAREAVGGGGTQPGGEQRLRIGVQQVGHGPSGEVGVPGPLGSLAQLWRWAHRGHCTAQHSSRVARSVQTPGVCKGYRVLSSAAAIWRAAEAMGSGEQEGSGYGTVLAKKR